MITFFWSFGIHGDSIVGSVVRPLWLMLLEQNATALANGQHIPHIAAEPFIPMVYLDWRFRNNVRILQYCYWLKSNLAYGKLWEKRQFFPSIFNIKRANSFFGAPIVLNPTLLPPS